MDEGKLLPRAFACLFGLFLGLTFLKFGNPPIMEKWVSSPNDLWEFLLNAPWPIGWAYRLLGLITLLGLFLALRTTAAGPARGSRPPRWLLVLPVVWLACQVVATILTQDSELSNPTLEHLAACVVCFYLGYFALSRVNDLGWFWLGFLGGFVLLLAAGWDQHFGGLAETRRYFFLYIYPTLKEVPPEYLKKISSDRIFATLFYPNTLAGALLLLLPVMLGLVWSVRACFTPPARWFLAVLVAGAALPCLLWSGSKGGWLLMLSLGLLALLRLPFAKSYKIALVAAVLLVGLAGFFWRYAAFFQKGATSVSARFDYWQAAVKTANAKPFFGTGPGTFAIPYAKIKRPESEMARLVHNDYFEQASDSGWPAFAVYLVFMVGGLAAAVPRTAVRAGSRAEDWLAWSVWLGVLGWAAQSAVEFSLYIPALAWTAFTFLGLLLGRNRAPAP